MFLSKCTLFSKISRSVSHVSCCLLILYFLSELDFTCFLVFLSWKSASLGWVCLSFHFCYLFMKFDFIQVIFYCFRLLQYSFTCTYTEEVLLVCALLAVWPGTIKVNVKLSKLTCNFKEKELSSTLMSTGDFLLLLSWTEISVLSKTALNSCMCRN